MRIIFLTLLLLFSLSFLQVARAEHQHESPFHFYVNPVPEPEDVIIEIILTNESNQTLEFEAPTSQWFDFTITNEKEEIVYQYSNGRSFLQAFQKLTLEPGDSKKWSVSLSEPYGQHLLPGKYIINAKLKAISVNGEELKGYHSLMDQKEMVVPPKNPIIKNVTIKRNGDWLEISGYAKPFVRELFYVIEDGHRELVKETMIKVDGNHSSWGNFFIKINMPKQGVSFILYLYEKDQSRRLLHVYPKKIE